MELQKREYWIDFIKGIAILLVIICHIRGQYATDEFEILIGTLHNPAFYFASGYLYAQTKKKYGKQLFIKNMMRLLVPFMEWSIIWGILEWVICKVSVINAIIGATQKLWFLAVLFICTVFASLLDHYQISIKWVYLTFVICLVVGVYTSSMIAKILEAMLIFRIGIDWNRFKPTRKMACIPVVFWMIGIVLMYEGVFDYSDTITPSGYRLLIYLVVCICGGCLMNGIALNSENHITENNFKLIRYVGRNSLYFYVLHFGGIYYLEHSQVNMINCVIASIMCMGLPIIYVQTLKKTFVEKILFTPQFKHRVHM